ncbi:MAG: hypothetical protein Fur0010_22370 [Bdellovibrio sp.]
MQFLLKASPFFQSIQQNGASLFFRGQCHNKSWEGILSSLNRGYFPDEIRGEFAFVWIKGNDWIAAVDHVNQYPLFYSNDFVSPVFSEIIKTHSKLTSNPVAKWELKLLFGFTYGEDTLYKEIKTLPAGHFVKNGIVKRYVDYFHYSGKENFDYKEFKNILDNEILRYATDKNVLLTSGGTDSITLATAIKDLNLQSKFKFLFLHSPYGLFDERELALDCYKKLGLELIVYELPFQDFSKADPAVIERTHSFWKDRSWLSKSQAIRNLGFEDHTIFTGEVGDQLFGGSKIESQMLTHLQLPQLSATDFARQYINMCLTDHKLNGHGKSAQFLAFHENQETADIWNQLETKLAEILELNETSDVGNKFILLHYLTKAPSRIWASSQDTLKVIHPLASWNVFDFSMKIPSYMKIGNGGIKKYLFMKAYENSIPVRPFLEPKYNGVMIPIVGVQQ